MKSCTESGGESRFKSGTKSGARSGSDHIWVSSPSSNTGMVSMGTLMYALEMSTCLIESRLPSSTTCFFVGNSFSVPLCVSQESAWESISQLHSLHDSLLSTGRYVNSGIEPKDPAGGRLPADLPAGDYVVGWRWDCEMTAQVWAGCGDVSVEGRGVIVQGWSRRSCACSFIFRARFDARGRGPKAARGGRPRPQAGLGRWFVVSREGGWGTGRGARVRAPKQTYIHKYINT